MNAYKYQDTLTQIERNMKLHAPFRKTALFNEFLVKGYTAITLSSVSEDRFSDILRAKICLGTLITLYDDLADRPTQCNPQLLEILYQMSFQNKIQIKNQNANDRRLVEFADSLFSEIENTLRPQPQYGQLKEILRFDLLQFFSANRYSTLVTMNPFLNSPLENRHYTHHNMGMVIVATMDLMASPKIEVSEIGSMREVFLLSQRLGRIFNVLTTRQREILDGDITSELAICASEQEVLIAEINLRREARDLYNKIAEYKDRIKTFSVQSYLEGLMDVQALHEEMEGTI